MNDHGGRGVTLRMALQLPPPGTWLVWTMAHTVDGTEALVEWTGRGLSADMWEVTSPWGPRYASLDALRYATAHELLTPEDDD